MAGLLDELKLSYSYEPELRGAGGSLRRPDFVIDDQESGRMVIVEHLGMMNDPGYAAGWKQKLEWYRVSDILLYEEGGGAVGTLVVSDDRNGFDEQDLRTRILAALGLAQPD